VQSARENAREKLNLFPLVPSRLVCDRVGSMAAALSPFPFLSPFSFFFCWPEDYVNGHDDRANLLLSNVCVHNAIRKLGKMKMKIVLVCAYLIPAPQVTTLE
jgi:hypothetical protein